MVEWGNYAEAYKAIHDKLDEILSKLDYPVDPAVQDVIDRADRVLGRVYGSQGQQLKQRVSTYELMVQLVHQGVEYQAGGGGSGVVQCQIRNEADDAWLNEPFARRVTPSGDMARKAFYDRNPSLIVKAWHGNVAPGDATNWTEKWSYTVPSGKKAHVYLCFFNARTAVATSGRVCGNQVQYQKSGGSYETIAFQLNYYGGPSEMAETIQLQFDMLGGDMLRGQVKSDDTVTHWLGPHCLITEFDE